MKSYAEIKKCIYMIRNMYKKCIYMIHNMYKKLQVSSSQLIQINN